MSLVAAVLVASLLGSVHCAGMCGAFVCFYAGGAPRGAGFRAHAAYNAGRLASYASLGALAGLIGARVNSLGELAGVSRAAAVVAGTMMVLWGAGRIAATLGVRLPASGIAAPLQRRLTSALAAARGRPPVVRAGLTGLLTTLLPCGWLYTFVATAGGTGHAAYGAAVMIVFWAGTLPMMLAVGAGAQRAFGPLRQRLPMVTAAALVVMGVLSIAGKMSVAPHAGAHGGLQSPAPAHAHDAR